MPGPKEAISLLVGFYADNPVRLLTSYDGKKVSNICGFVDKKLYLWPP